MDKAVKTYFEGIPDERREMMQTLHEIIIALYPDIDLTMKYKMPTYSLDDGWVAIANQKQYVSLYTCGAHHIAGFKKDHPSIKTGKGCINFKPKDSLPAQAIRDVIQHAIDHPKP